MSTALVKLRSERDRMSAIERRIADFIIENAHLLRDYSSQQLANALGISQSSVVKFCQKLGFKGYPDLKLAISEAVIRADSNGGPPPPPPRGPILTVHNFDPAHMTASLSAARPDDVLLVFSEHGLQPALCQLAQHMRAQRGKVITVTRHSANALRALADMAMLVSAHDERPQIEPLLYHSALQHLLDRLFMRLYEGDAARRTRLQETLDRQKGTAKGDGGN